MKQNSYRFALLAALAMAGACCTGQAVADHPGQGAVAATFLLPSGARAYVEGMPGAWWLRLPQRHVELRASTLAFRSAQQVGEDTVIVFEQSTPKCRSGLLLVWQREAEVRTWELGNCHTLPVVRMNSGGSAIEVDAAGADGRTLKRYRLADGRLDAEAAIPSPVVLPTAANAGKAEKERRNPPPRRPAAPEFGKQVPQTIEVR